MLKPYFLGPVVNLCISDVHKELLIGADGCRVMISLLTEALLLDPSHLRQVCYYTSKSHGNPTDRLTSIMT